MRVCEVNALKREDAYYYMNLLLLGFSDGYDEWLESYLKTDEPMSDLVIDLYFSGSDVKKLYLCCITIVVNKNSINLLFLISLGCSLKRLIAPVE